MGDIACAVLHEATREIAQFGRVQFVQHLMLCADCATYVRRLRELLSRSIGHATGWLDVIEDLSPLRSAAKKSGKWVEPSLKLIFIGCEAIWRTRPSKSSDSNDSPDSHHTCALRDEILPRVPIQPVLKLDAGATGQSSVEMLMKQGRRHCGRSLVPVGGIHETRSIPVCADESADDSTDVQLDMRQTILRG